MATCQAFKNGQFDSKFFDIAMILRSTSDERVVVDAVGVDALLHNEMLMLDRRLGG